MKPLRSVRVSVPASTSNLGPAFDCLGMALDLRNELTLELYKDPGEVVAEIEGEGAGKLPAGRATLLAKAALCVLGSRHEGLIVLKAVNRIPTSRGLGSSAAAIVAGLYAANAVLDAPLSDEELFKYAVTLEGHPDNVAPALYGGLQLSTSDETKLPRLHALMPHPELRAVVCVPAFELATSEARAVLPRTVLREQAVDNISRALLLASALERGRWADLAAAMQDTIHQPYRAPLIKGLTSVLRAARKAGQCGAALSGAGPSVLALCRRGTGEEAIGAAMTAAFLAQGVESRSLLLSVDRQGARRL